MTKNLMHLPNKNRSSQFALSTSYLPSEISDPDFRAMATSLSEMQRYAFEFTLKWCREKHKIFLSVKPTQVDPIYVFVTGGASFGKSHLIKAVYQLVPETFKGSSEHLDQEYPPVLLLAPTGVAAINIHGTTVNSGLAIPKRVYGNNVLPLSDARKTSIRTKLSNLTLIIIDEISMVLNNRLKHIHERLQEIFCASNSQMFAGITIAAVGDFFNFYLSKCSEYSICIQILLSIFAIHGLIILKW